MCFTKLIHLYSTKLPTLYLIQFPRIHQNSIAQRQSFQFQLAALSHITTPPKFRKISPAITHRSARFSLLSRSAFSRISPQENINSTLTRITQVYIPTYTRGARSMGSRACNSIFFSSSEPTISGDIFSFAPRECGAYLPPRR